MLTFFYRYQSNCANVPVIVVKRFPTQYDFTRWIKNSNREYPIEHQRIEIPSSCVEKALGKKVYYGGELLDWPEGWQ